MKFLATKNKFVGEIDCIAVCFKPKKGPKNSNFRSSLSSNLIKFIQKNKIRTLKVHRLPTPLDAII